MAADKILIVDDEPDALENCRRMLAGPRYECLIEIDPQRALHTIERERPRVLLTDLRMPGLDGIDLLKAAKRLDPFIKVVLLTAYASIETAVSSMRHGAIDYLAKPFGSKELREVVQRALDAGSEERSDSEPVAAPPSKYDEASSPEPALWGASAPIRAARALVERLIDTDAAILLHGERGTGRERIARMIHAGSPRRSGRFIPVDCLASDEALVEQELFGGDSGLSPGGRLLESAHGGTLFFDEVAELSPRLQARVLRALKEGRARRQQGLDFYRLDVRVIAATTRDLQQACRAGSFREDLYHFVSVAPVNIPPLRERRSDIEELVSLLLRPSMSRNPGRPTPMGFTPDALAKLSRYHWPGNVQELRCVVERAALLAEEPLIGSPCLPDYIRSL